MTVVLDNIRSALNVGSIIRTCDALGIKEVFSCGITPGIVNPKVKKTSLGAEDNIKEVCFKSTKEAVNHLKKLGYTIIGLEINDKSIDIKKFKTSKNIALVIGNEVSGIAEDVQDACDFLVKIPMKGKKESLNVAVAFGIAVYVLNK